MTFHHKHHLNSLQKIKYFIKIDVETNFMENTELNLSIISGNLLKFKSNLDDSAAE